MFHGKQLGREPLSAEDLAGLAITMEDFQAAIGKVQPSVRREGFATTPDVTWDDVRALREVRLPLPLPAAISGTVAAQPLGDQEGLTRFANKSHCRQHLAKPS